jgi:cell wall-associated NlpC family hydrolase
MKGIVQIWLGLACAFALIFCCLGVSKFLTGDDDDHEAAYGALDVTKVPAKYLKWITKAAQQCDLITAPLIAAQIEAESNWNPKAESHDKQGNPIAQGISQFTPGTWAAWGNDGDDDGEIDVWNPADAIISQAFYDCYLAGQVTKLLEDNTISGDPVELTLAAYNAGLNRVKNAGGIPKITETQNYVAKIQRLKATYTAAAAAAGGSFGAAIVKNAEKWLGTPYSWGGGGINGPSTGFAQGAGISGFDCSSLVQNAVYHASGGKLLLPRTTKGQVKKGTHVSRSDIQVGDAIYVDNDLILVGVDHVGIYIGNNRWIHAPHTGSVVRYDTISEKYWAASEIRRFG